MDPFSRLSNQMEVQVKEKERKGGVILSHDLLDEISVDRLIPKEDLYGLNPRLVDFSFAYFFVAVTQMKADKTYQLVIRTGFSSLSQKWNRHDALLSFYRAIERGD
jgi:hypothetical protein